MSKALLINPSYSPSYGGTKVSVVNPIYPTLGLATIAATALERGHKVEMLDMSWRPYDFELIRNRILKFKPDIVGITDVYAAGEEPIKNRNRDSLVSGLKTRGHRNAFAIKNEQDFQTLRLRFLRCFHPREENLILILPRFGVLYRRLLPTRLRSHCDGHNTRNLE